MSIDTMTVGELIGSIGEGRPGAIGVLRTLLTGRSKMVPASQCEELHKDGNVGHVDEAEVMMAKPMKQEAMPKDLLPESIDPDSLFMKHFEDKELNGVHMILALGREGFAGEEIEDLYTKGCHENVIVFNLCNLLHTLGNIDGDKLHQAADGLYDLQEHIKWSPAAAAAANTAEAELEEDKPFGYAPLEKIIEKEIETGDYELVKDEDEDEEI